MFHREHQKILRRVRREAERRGILLCRFKRIHDDSVSVEYHAGDWRRDEEASVIVTITYRYDDELTDNGNPNYMIYKDATGQVYSALFLAVDSVEYREYRKRMDAGLEKYRIKGASQ